MRVTLKTIAQKTGYSVTTVSRALAGYDDVAEDTRRLILATAKQLEYRPNDAARRLRFQRADTIGLIIPTFGPRFSDPFFIELLTGIGDQAAAHHFGLLVSIQAPGPGEIEAYRRMEGGRVDGLIVVRTRQHDPRIRYLCQTKTPFVAFGRSNGRADFPYVDVGGEQGMREMVQHLIDQGHRRIGYVAPPLDLNFSRHRIAGYRAALEANGLPYTASFIIPGDMTRHGGTKSARRLLDITPPLTAILAGNDLMAFGVIQAARARGLTVGSDLAVGGFDDIPGAEYSHPPLTTIRQPVYQIGLQVCDMLIKVVRGEPLQQQHILLKPELIIRASTGGIMVT